MVGHLLQEKDLEVQAVVDVLAVDSFVRLKMVYARHSY